MVKGQAHQEISLRRVTQVNTGQDTPGIDKVTVKTPEARTALLPESSTYEPWKVQPVRRVGIPKTNGKKRPLGIPTSLARCLQALALQALEPEWEAKFAPRSYGFRPGRSCQDAMSRISANLIPTTRRKWSVEAAITGACDHIRHETVWSTIRGFPGQHLIKAWLKAGLMEKGHLEDPEAGTPQGGVISPLLANSALQGMEEALGIF